MNTSEALRYGRQVALAEFGPQGQERLLQAAVAFVVGHEDQIAVKTAALYLACAGVQRFRVVLCDGVASPAWVSELEERFAAAATVDVVHLSTWSAALEGCNLALCGRSNEAFADACSRRRIAALVVNGGANGVDLLSLRHSPLVAGDVSMLSHPSSAGGAPGVFAGTLAACEALWLLVDRSFLAHDADAAATNIIRHMHVPFLTPNAPPNTHNIPWPLPPVPQQP